MSNQLFARKNLDALLAEAKGDNRLKRVLGPVTLTSLGVGAVIGAGIFVSTGEAARNVAGPALMLSYVIAGVACIFAALCYAEFASMAPVAGSAYTYAYCTMGELFAWIIGWDLVLEYAVGAATVANGWSSYFQKVLKAGFGHELPASIASAPMRWNHEGPWDDPSSWVEFTGAYINLPAVLIAVVVTAFLVKGISESAGFNALMVFIKVAAVLFVIVVGVFYINPSNYTDNATATRPGGFAPFGYGGFSFFGIESLTIGEVFKGKPVGMLAGAAIIFFAYIGFDSVSTHAEEARNPQKDVPKAIVASLILCTVLYVAVVAVLTGMVPYYEIDEGAGVSSAFAVKGLRWAEFIISAAGVAGITSVLLVMMLSGPRVFLAMARDGLVPKGFFAAVHPKFKTPWKSTIAIGVFVSILAGLLPINALLELTNIGTLFAFTIVCGAVLIMRRTNPNAIRPFRCPLVPVIPVLGILMSLMLMMSLPVGNWMRLIGWLVLGLVIYFCYGRYHSTLGKELAASTPLGAK